jgi:hypothetical protein
LFSCFLLSGTAMANRTGRLGFQVQAHAHIQRARRVKEGMPQSM